MGRDILESTVRSLFIDEKAGKVIRVKGFVQTGDNEQVQINATAKEIEISPQVSSRNVIIIIGEQLDRQYINGIFKDYCSVVSL